VTRSQDVPGHPCPEAGADPGHPQAGRRGGEALPGCGRAGDRPAQRVREPGGVL